MTERKTAEQWRAATKSTELLWIFDLVSADRQRSCRCLGNSIRVGVSISHS